MGRIIPRTAIPIGNKEFAVALQRLLAGEDFAGGDIAGFEDELADYLGVEKIFALNSGRTALYMSLEALDLEPSQEVIVPAYTCAIVFEVVMRLGLKPVLVDVNPATYNIDPELVSKAITSKTRVIVPVHLFGRPCEMDEILEIAEKHSLYIIEDVAQALGAEYKKIKVGTFGDLAMFSFGPGKSMTSGEGGAIAVNNEELLDEIIVGQAKLSDAGLNWAFHVLRNIISMKIFSNRCLYALVKGRLDKDVNKTDRKILENCINLVRQEDRVNLHSTITLAKMPPFSAKIARMQLEKLDEFNDKRIINAVTLTEFSKSLNEYIQLPKMSDGAKSTFTRYPITLLKGSREEVIKGLIKQGVDVGKPYGYLPDVFSSLGVKAPNACTIATSILTIPNHPLLESSDVLRIANTLAGLLVKV